MSADLNVSSDWEGGGEGCETAPESAARHGRGGRGRQGGQSQGLYYSCKLYLKIVWHRHNALCMHDANNDAQVIAAEGEQKASRALREASNTIAESSSALQLRYLQVRTLDN